MGVTACCLTDLEVLHDEIAARVQLSLRARQRVEVLVHGVLGILVLYEELLSRRLLTGLVQDALVLCIDTGIGLPHKGLVGRLRIRLGTDGVLLRSLGVVNDLMDHPHHSTA